jgi:hypothetical protein
MRNPSGKGRRHMGMAMHLTENPQIDSHISGTRKPATHQLRIS